MIYITFEEYTQRGGKADRSAFVALERKARKKLDYFTQDRIKGLDVITDDIKDCMAEMIDVLSEQQGEKVSSFSNGSVSVSFAADQETDDTKLWNAAVECLPINLISLAVES